MMHSQAYVRFMSSKNKPRTAGDQCPHSDLLLDFYNQCLLNEKLPNLRALKHNDGKIWTMTI